MLLKSGAFTYPGILGMDQNHLDQANLEVDTRETQVSSGLDL